MEISKKIELLEDMMDLDAGTLTPDTELASLDEWDSLAKLSLIILFQDEFDKKITGEQVRAFTTVEEILNCME